MNKKRNIVFIILAAGFLFWSCDHGQIGGADKTDTYYPEDALFNEHMAFFCGVWYSYYDGELLDGYRISKWSDFSAEDKARAQSLFSGTSFDGDNPKTYSTQVSPEDGDYVVLFDDNASGESWGFGYMGLVQAVNIFNGDKNRGAIIIKYFEGADPLWLSDPDGYAYQGLERGEKPFFGIYYKVLSSDAVQMANVIDLAALYEGKPYYTEKDTLEKAIGTFTVENEAEFVNYAATAIQNREE